jgi:hypothetical protein
MTKISYIDGDIKSMMRHSLLVYHSIFPSPVYVLCQWFTTIGNGMEWDEKDGKLKQGYNDPDSELWTPRHRDIYPEDSALKELYEKRKLQNEWEDIEWDFIRNNIDRILESDYVNDFKSGSIGNKYYVTKGICTKYARAFTFPDNIDKEWAKLLYKFFDWWYVRLNMEYGVGNGKTNADWRSHWPKDIFDAAVEMDKARDRLCVIIYGQTQAERDEATRKLMEELMKDIK